MPFYRINGMTVHMRGTRLPAPCAASILLEGKTILCLAPSAFLCDGPPPAERARDHHDTGTCDRHLCAAHAHQVGKNKHYCPAHRQQHLDDQAQGGLFTSLVQS